MTYRSTTLRTKKKSSDLDWPIAMSTISILGLFAIYTFAFRFETMQAIYNVVSAELPIVQSSVDDPSFHYYEETPYDSIKGQTAAVVMTVSGFYFGDLEAFSTDIGKTGNKFMVPYVDGVPLTGDLIKEMNVWRADRSKKQNTPDDHILVLIPSGDIPMNIVIQVIAHLKTHGDYARVILGGGFAI